MLFLTHRGSSQEVYYEDTAEILYTIELGLGLCVILSSMGRVEYVFDGEKVRKQL